MAKKNYLQRLLLLLASRTKDEILERQIDLLRQDMEREYKLDPVPVDEFDR